MTTPVLEQQQNPPAGWFAQQGQPPYAPQQTSAPTSGAPASRYFSEEEVEAIRKQEKDKLYGEIQTLKKSQEELLAATREREEREAQVIAEAEATKAEAARLAEEENMSALEIVRKRDQDWKRELEERESKWRSELEQTKQEAAAASALVQKEREFNELAMYTQQRIAEHSEDLVPEMVNWIKGNSKDEIDQALAEALAASQSIAEKIQAFRQQQPEGFVAQVPQGASVASGPVGTDPAQQFQQLSAEQIKALPYDEYVRLRPQLLRAGSGGNNQGMYS